MRLLGVIHRVVTEREIYTLYDAFKSISSSRVDDGVIDEQCGNLGRTHA